MSMRLSASIFAHVAFVFAFAFVAFAALTRADESSLPFPASLSSLSSLSSLTSAATSLQGISRRQAVVVKKLLHPLQRPAMAQMREAWGRFVDLSSWNESNYCYPSGWRFVNCNPDGTVWKIDVSGNSLFTELPPKIGELWTLREFYCFNNYLYGPIPATFAYLTNINVLVLRANYFNGTIPEIFRNLTKLNQLQLNINYFEGPIPTSLQRIPQMQKLYLSSGLLSGPIPTFLCTMTSLLELRLSGNRLTGTIPSCFNQLPKVYYLYLDTNRLTGTIPASFGDVPNLQNLFLNQNNLTGPIPPAIGRAKKLNILFLSSNYLTGPLPKELGNIPTLTDLVMEFNNVDGSIPTELGKLTRLKRLLLDNNRLVGTIPATLGNCKQITILYLETNRLAGSVPTSISTIPGLWLLNLANNQLSGRAPTNFVNSTYGQLGQYNINNNFFNGVPSFTAGGKPFCPTSRMVRGVFFPSNIDTNCFAIPANFSCSYPRAVAPSTCKTFCGANSPEGTCGGHGWCSFSNTYPTTCYCDPGYTPVLPLGRTCVPVKTRLGIRSSSSSSSSSSTLPRTLVRTLSPAAVYKWQHSHWYHVEAVAPPQVIPASSTAVTLASSSSRGILKKRRGKGGKGRRASHAGTLEWVHIHEAH